MGLSYFQMVLIRKRKDFAPIRFNITIRYRWFRTHYPVRSDFSIHFHTFAMIYLPGYF
jgi:hypothetical protein